LDIIYYHDNYEALGNEKNWEYIDNRADDDVNGSDLYNGFRLKNKHMIQKEPSVVKTEEKEELSEAAEQFYRDLLQYATEQDFQFLMVASPYILSEDDMKQLNYMEDVAEEYNIAFVNTNKYYAEMGIDFERDYHDVNHANLSGALKYTEYLGNYICGNMQVSDRRGEDGYEEWDGLYAEYQRTEIAYLDQINAQADSVINRHENEMYLAQCSDVIEWISGASDSKLTKFVLNNSSISEGEISAQDELALKSMGINANLVYTANTKQVCGETISYENGDGVLATGTVGRLEVEFSISNGEEPFICIDGVNYYDDDEQGIQIVLYDGEYNEVTDHVVISGDESGNLVLKHTVNNGK
jgi:hypothetical protein